MRVGLIVNPVAGVGGPLALKGSDGALGAAALAAGARPAGGARAALALAALKTASGEVTIVTSAGAMGGDVAAAAGVPVEVVHAASGGPSSARDTIAAAARIAAQVDLLLFAGGDGTARDVMAAVGERVPVLGIPAGVKMHSAVFATSPRAAGALLADLVARGGPGATAAAEILDRPATGAAPRLYGVMRTPEDRQRLQGRKAAAASDSAEVEAACRAVARLIADDAVTIIGPGATMQRLKALLGIDATLLGVDAVQGGRCVAADADAATLRALTQGRRARLVLGVVGGQGFLLGRGNQQIDAALVDAVRREDIIVVASAAKLAALPNGRLLVDTGDAGLDDRLAGYIPVHTGGGKRAMMRVDAA
jgi:predicted polyphosphate/ATP-dependent NAD kinase